MTPREHIAAFIGILIDGEVVLTDPETAGVVAEVARSLGRDIDIRTHPWLPSGRPGCIYALTRFAHIDVVTGGPAGDRNTERRET